MASMGVVAKYDDKIKKIENSEGAECCEFFHGKENKEFDWSENNLG